MIQSFQQFVNSRRLAEQEEAKAAVQEVEEVKEEVNEIAQNVTIDQVLESAIENLIDKNTNVCIVVDGSGSMDRSPAFEKIVGPMYNAFFPKAKSVTLSVFDEQRGLVDCRDIDVMKGQTGRGGTPELSIVLDSIAATDDQVVYYITDQLDDSIAEGDIEFNPDQSITIIANIFSKAAVRSIENIEDPDANISLVQIPF